MDKRMIQAILGAIAVATLFTGIWMSSEASRIAGLQSNNETPSPADEGVGVYKGTLPCANCSGTVSELTLASSNQYQLKETRSGLNETPHETSGTWDILLQDDGKGTMKKIFRLNPDRPDKVRYFRPAGMDLVLLDTNGKEITDTIPHILQLQK